MAVTIKHIVIIGGGTAGWLTASMLAADHLAHAPDGLRVTLIEAPNIPILGVGEGAWPSLRDTLRRIGIRETAFVRACEASFKQGSRFDGWTTGAAHDCYFHPFEAPPDPDEIDAAAVWRASPDGMTFADAVSVQPALCLHDKAPKQTGTPEYAAVANYAYHLDAPAFAAMLREHATTTLGVRHIADEVVATERTADGDIAAVLTRGSGAIAGDVFVDCTGARAQLIGDEMGAPLSDVSSVLFNDHALAVQVPHAAADLVSSQTTATAVDFGWIWDIALARRRGVGLVFASAFATETQARAALTRYLERTAPASGLTGDDARLLTFRSAFRREPWRGNVVAIGMAQGFVEPLEASAIVMIELSATLLSDILPANRSGLAAAARTFNARFSYRWERIVDFLKLHYVLSRREQPYWTQHRDPLTAPDRLAEGLDRWRYDPPSREDFPQSREIFTASSYAYVLNGMGFPTKPRAIRRRKDDPAIAERYVRDIAARKRKLLAGLPTNNELIAHIGALGLTRV